MEKKYIIELKDDELAYQTIIIDGTPYIKPLQLLPYAEPDLEQVRKEAYEKGWKEAENHYEEGYNDGYDTGLDDAWEAARKISSMTYDDMWKIFDCCDWNVVKRYTAQDVIEKLKAYEQKQEEIQVGDEVEGDEDGQRGVVIDSRFENSQVAVLTGNSKVYSWWSKCAIHKTGRHFHEIAAVLEKMREE